MSGLDFLDTNILVYAYQTSDPRKRKVARGLLARAVGGECVISIQVLAEFASVLLHKLQPPLPRDKVDDTLNGLGPVRTVTPDAQLVRRAVEAHAIYGIRFYDGMIVAAAERAGCGRIWSEDMNSKQQYFGVTVVNPF